MKRLILIVLSVLFIVSIFIAFNFSNNPPEDEYKTSDAVLEKRAQETEAKEKEETRLTELVNEERLVKANGNTIRVYYKVHQDKFIGYEISHLNKEKDTNAISSNYDIWQLNSAKLYNYKNGKFSTESDFITVGEWDFAIRESGANDYSGGYSHGDEQTTEFEVKIDGNDVEKDKLVPFNTVEINTKSTVFRDNTIENSEDFELAKRDRKLLFDDNQLTINQDINFLSDLTLDRGYLAMLPVLREDTHGNQITDTAIVNEETFDVSESGFETEQLRNYTVDNMKIEGQESGLSATVEVLESNKQPVELTVSNNPAYNKIYFKNGGENVNVNSGEKWNQTTNYMLNYED